MPLILSQKRHQGLYNDVIGEYYHYPVKYRSYVQPGEFFIYYHPAEPQDRARYYFGMGRIGAITNDSAQPDHCYAEILDYEPFPQPIPFKDGDIYLEHRDHVGTRFFSAIRHASSEIINRILSYLPDVHVTIEPPLPISDEQRLAAFNAKYAHATPEAYQQITTVIDRPTSISRALKNIVGSTCQICGYEGFEKKTGGMYCEAHHVIELHQRIPGSLVTDNIVIVCATCHRKLHYGTVTIEHVDTTSMDITINGETTRVQRHRIG